MQENISKFGNLAKEYDAIRPPYPKEAISLVREAILGDKPLVLDLGCGTGISTRQVAETGAVVIGCDIDGEMIASALGHRQNNTAYVQSMAGSLPFGDDIFDGVTIFTALHWFCGDESIREIKRVIRPGGALCSVQPEHTTTFAGDHRKLINERFPQQTAPEYSKRDFTEAITAGGFSNTRTTVIKETHTYTLDQFLTLLQSYSVWNQVPELERESMLSTLREHFKTRLEDGYIQDTLDIKVILATK